MPILHCEQPAGSRHCAWNDNGYCHYKDTPEVLKRQQLAAANRIGPEIKPVCNQHQRESGWGGKQRW